MKKLLLLLLVASAPAWAQLSNAKQIWSRNIKSTAPTNGQCLVWVSATRLWTPASCGGGGAGTVTSITAGAGLTGGAITVSGTIALDTSYTNTLYPQLAVTSTYTAGAKQVFTASATTEGFNLVNSTLPSAPAAGALASNVVGSYANYDGAAWRYWWTGVNNAKTATYQVVAADFQLCKNIPVASGTFTITLVASGAQPTDGQCIRILNYGSGVVTVARSGQDINGAAANLTLAAGSASAPTGVYVWSNGTDYFAQPIGAGGGVTGPGSSTDTAVVRWSGVGGTALLDSHFTLNNGGDTFKTDQNNLYLTTSSSGTYIRLVDGATINFNCVGGNLCGQFAANGHLELASTTAPTISAGFGTGATRVGNDGLGAVTIGTSPGGSGTVTFVNNQWSNAPICLAQNITSGLAVKATASTSVLTLTGTFIAADVVNYQCGGWQ